MVQVILWRGFIQSSCPTAGQRGSHWGAGLWLDRSLPPAGEDEGLLPAVCNQRAGSGLSLAFHVSLSSW